MFDNIYKDRTVLVTGHTGFKGSWLAIWLKELGASVVGYSLEPPSDPNNFEASHLRDRITHIHGDVRNPDKLIDVFDRYKPEIVLHLAAQPIVRISYADPKLTFDTNVGGTVNVFEAIRKTSSVKVLVNITSDKCYENREWVWGYRENDPMGGHDPYSASKGCAEIVFGAYLRSFFSEIVVGAASVRAGNVIGGGDWGKDRLIPDCIRALSSGQAIGVRNPSAVRPWQHVLEPLGGYLALGAHLWGNPSKFSGSWNFGPDEKDTLNVGQVTDLLIKNWGSGSWKDLSDPNALHEAHLLKLNCDKVHAELGWHATFTVDECVSMTSEWYKKFYEAPRGNDMYPLCVTQIKRYEELAASRYKL